jgi:hypothetical protein
MQLVRVVCDPCFGAEDRCLYLEEYVLRLKALR